MIEVSLNDMQSLAWRTRGNGSANEELNYAQSVYKTMVKTKTYDGAMDAGIRNR